MLIRIALLWLRWVQHFRAGSSQELSLTVRLPPSLSGCFSVTPRFWQVTRISAFPCTSLFLLTTFFIRLAQSCSLHLVSHSVSPPNPNVSQPLTIFPHPSPPFFIWSYWKKSLGSYSITYELLHLLFDFFIFASEVKLTFQAAPKFTMKVRMTLNFCWATCSRCWVYRYTPPYCLCEGEALPRWEVPLQPIWICFLTSFFF